MRIVLRFASRRATSAMKLSAARTTCNSRGGEFPGIIFPAASLRSQRKSGATCGRRLFTNHISAKHSAASSDRKLFFPPFCRQKEQEQPAYRVHSGKQDNGSSPDDRADLRRRRSAFLNREPEPGRASADSGQRDQAGRQVEPTHRITRSSPSIRESRYRALAAGSPALQTAMTMIAMTTRAKHATTHLPRLMFRLGTIDLQRFRVHQKSTTATRHVATARSMQSPTTRS